MSEKHLTTVHNSFSAFVLLIAMLQLAGCNKNTATGDNATTLSDPAATDITDTIMTSSSANCADYADSYKSTVMDINNSASFAGSLSITVSGNKCIFTTNAIPNHNFNDGTKAFAHNVSAQNKTYQMTTAPAQASAVTELTLGIDNAIFLNGVKLDLLAAGCYGIADGKTGCHSMSQPWRYDPMSVYNDFATDSHHAHAQADGTYHYHGSPMALFYTDTAIVSPVVGFAADGFPIFGSYFDDNGTVRKATSSYQLKAGSRVAINGINPGGTYDGTFRDDYEYSPGSGDLDECNGMMVNGVYGYYITDSYPWVLACLKSTPDASFTK